MDSLEREAKERKKKFIALASLPLCMGFFVWRVQTTTSAAPPPKPPPPPVVAQAAPAVAAAAGPVLSLERQRVVEVPLGDKDPFIASIDLAPATAANPASPVGPSGIPKQVLVTELGPSVSPLPPVNPALNTFGTPPGIPVGPSAAVNPVPAMSQTPAAPVAPPMPYVLCGIVKGNPDVAVLRHFDGSRRIVRTGDALDGRFRLESIQETAVVITGDGDSKTLRLGGDVPVAPAARK